MREDLKQIRNDKRLKQENKKQRQAFEQEGKARKLREACLQQTRDHDGVRR